MREINKRAKKSTLQMPNLEKQMTHVKDSKYFGLFDIQKAFNFLPVEEESRKFLVMITENSAYEYCGSPMGFVNTPVVFQNRIVNELLEEAKINGKDSIFLRNVLQWIDDSLLHAKTISEYLAALEAFLKQCIVMNVRISISKCTFLATEVEFCGRTISQRGWAFNKKYFETLQQMSKPTKVHDLAKVTHLAGWLSKALPHFARYRTLFHSAHPEITFKRKKLEKLNLDVKWTPELDKIWIELKKTLEAAQRTSLDFYDQNEDLLVLTDASSAFWSAVILQTPRITIQDEAQLKDDPERFIANRTVKPVMFLSGKFTAPQLKWHISEKEIFPIVHMAKSLDYMFIPHPRRIRFFTDHKNLLSVLQPTTVKNRNYWSRLERWALLLQDIAAVFYHIGDESNFVADMFSRFANPFFGDNPSSHGRVGVEKERLSGRDQDCNLHATKLTKTAIQCGAPEDNWHDPRSVSPDDSTTGKPRQQNKSHDNELATALDDDAFTGPQESVKRIKLSPRKERLSRESMHFSLLDSARVSFHNRYYDGEWKPIDIQTLKNAQQKYIHEQPENLVLDGTDGLLKQRKRIWIPPDLVERVLIHNHIASQHGNLLNECNVLFQNFILSTPRNWLGEDVSNRKGLEAVVGVLRNK